MNNYNFRSGLRYHNKVNGSILIMFAFFLPLLIVFSAFIIDLGNIHVAIVEMRIAAEAGAHAGAVELTVQGGDPEGVAEEYVQENFVGGSTIPSEDITVTTGEWDGSSFDDAGDTNAVRVSISYTVSYFFGAFFDDSSKEITVTSIAVMDPSGVGKPAIVK